MACVRPFSKKCGEKMKEETRSFYRDAVTQTAARIIDELDHELDLMAMARDVAMSSLDRKSVV